MGSRVPHAHPQGGPPSRRPTRPFTPKTTATANPTTTGPTHQVIVETDGFETHGTRAAFRADRAKDAALTASGYRVLRFTKDDDPALAIKRLRRPRVIQRLGFAR